MSEEAEVVEPITIKIRDQVSPKALPEAGGSKSGRDALDVATFGIHLHEW
jgi:hypothetical protein